MNKLFWPTKKIGDLFNVQLGKMLNQKARQGDLLPYLANFNVRWGAFDLSRLNEMTFSEKERTKFSLCSGDLLMCEGGEIGRCAVWKETKEDIYYQKALHRLRPLNQDITTEFIYYYMQHIASKGELPKLVGETSIAHLTREKLLCLRVPVPTTQEQTAITSLLSTWDQAIEKTELLISAKEKQLNALSQNLLTGNKRVKGYSEKWQKYRLHEVLTEHREVSSGREEVYSVSVHKGLINQIEHLGRVFAAKDTSNYNLVKPGDVVYTKSPTGEFSYGIVKQSRIEFSVIVSPLYGVFTPRSQQLGTFLNFYFESPSRTANYLVPIIQKGAKNTISITNSTFLSNNLYLPTCDEETKAIANILNTARLEIDLLKKQAEAFRRQKRGLMQKLLTGVWRGKGSKETLQ